MSGAKIKACIIGWPVAHSRSPLIHGYWLKKYGIDGSYTKRPVRPEEAADFFRHARGGPQSQLQRHDSTEGARQEEIRGRARHGRR